MRWRFLLFPARVEPVNAAAASATSALSALPLLVQASRPILDVGPGAMREGGRLGNWAYLATTSLAGAVQRAFWRVSEGNRVQCSSNKKGRIVERRPLCHLQSRCDLMQTERKKKRNKLVWMSRKGVQIWTPRRVTRRERESGRFGAGRHSIGNDGEH